MILVFVKNDFREKNDAEMSNPRMRILSSQHSGVKEIEEEILPAEIGNFLEVAAGAKIVVTHTLVPKSENSGSIYNWKWVSLSNRTIW